MPLSYCVDIRKLTYAELWRLAPGLSFLIAAFFKAFGVRLKMDAAVCTVEALTLLDESQIPPDVAGPLNAIARQWVGLGFHPAFYYTIPFPSPNQRSYGAALLSPDGATTGQVLFAESRAAGQVSSELQTHCFSLLTDGTFVGVSSEKRRMNEPPEYRGIHLQGKSPWTLYERHRGELEKMQRSFPVPQSVESLKGLLVRMNNRHVAFQASRGVYVPLQE